MRIVLFLIVALLGAEARAFHYNSNFSDHPYLRVYGSGGNYYTGSPRSYGMDCNACHTDSASIPPAERAWFEVTTVPSDLFTNGYQPGTQYELTFTVRNETRGRLDSANVPPNVGDQAILPYSATTSPWKAACPPTWGVPPQGGAERWLGFPGNRDQITAEVMSEAGTYANFAGNSAGTLRPDNGSGGSCDSASCCLNGASYCGGGQYSASPLAGATTAMFKNWRLDPTSNPPLGNWYCDTNCDALVSTNAVSNWLNDPVNPTPRIFRFFWTAPSSAPPEADGRIRFYVAGVDADGYFDTYDDYVFLNKLAACPVGAPAGCADVGPGWGTSPPPRTPPPSTTGPVGLWLLAAACLALMFLLQGWRKRIRPRFALTAAVVLVSVVGVSACVVVRPWERDHLASAVMTEGVDVGEATCEQTFFNAREGSTGGNAVGAGGGCACN